MKKSDWLIGALAMAALVFGVVTFLGRHDTLSQSDMKKELQVIAFIRETDCVKCIEKTLCYWQSVEEDFATDGITTRVIFLRESDAFKAEELAHLCLPPEGLELLQYAKFEQKHIMPLSTPSVLITNGGQSLFLEPIFLDTDMEGVHAAMRRAIGLFLPKTT